MLCEKCGKNMATTHYRQIFNGQEKEVHLCDECAKAHGMEGTIGPILVDFGNLLGQMFGQAVSSGAQSGAQKKRCSGCGVSFQDIVNSGKAGCAQCYTEFYEQLLPSIQRIHGKTEHVGKLSSHAGEAVRKESAIKRYKEELKQAIAEQNFEKAAELRDTIKSIEEGGEDNA